MRNKVITVPKNKFAEQVLNFNQAQKEQLIELYLNDEEFEILYKKKLFELINQIAETNIDEYEDDSVSGKEKIGNVLTRLNLENYSLDDEYNKLIKKIINLFEEAFNRDTAIYFHF